MKKLVLVLGLVMGSMLASDAIAAVSYDGVAIEHNDSDKKKCKKKCKKECCKKTEAASKPKSCSKEGASCCKKKATPTPTETTPSK
jgi:hypothetical protein